MNKIVFITFADSKYKLSLKRLREQIAQSEVFTDMFFFSEKDLDEDFKKTFHPWLYRRGYGYWQWKSYLTKKVLEELDNGDILIWADAGCEYNKNAESRLHYYIEQAKKSKSGLLVFSQKEIERRWTKGDCFSYFNVLQDKSITDTPQLWAGAFVINKNKNSTEVINKWTDVAMNHFDLITDKKSFIPDFPDFIEHRHDQSVFSILAKIYYAETMPPSEISKNNYENVPFQAKRHRQKSILINIGAKCLLPLRLLIGLYLKHVEKFQFRKRIVW